MMGPLLARAPFNRIHATRLATLMDVYVEEWFRDPSSLGREATIIRAVDLILRPTVRSLLEAWTAHRETLYDDTAQRAQYPPPESTDVNQVSLTVILTALLTQYMGAVGLCGETRREVPDYVLSGSLIDKIQDGLGDNLGALYHDLWWDAANPLDPTTMPLEALDEDLYNSQILIGGLPHLPPGVTRMPPVPEFRVNSCKTEAEIRLAFDEWPEAHTISNIGILLRRWSREAREAQMRLEAMEDAQADTAAMEEDEEITPYREGDPVPDTPASPPPDSSSDSSQSDIEVVRDSRPTEEEDRLAMPPPPVPRRANPRAPPRTTTGTSASQATAAPSASVPLAARIANTSAPPASSVPATINVPATSTPSLASRIEQPLSQRLSLTGPLPRARPLFTEAHPAADGSTPHTDGNIPIIRKVANGIAPDLGEQAILLGIIRRCREELRVRGARQFASIAELRGVPRFTYALGAAFHPTGHRFSGKQTQRICLWMRTAQELLDAVCYIPDEFTNYTPVDFTPLQRARDPNSRRSNKRARVPSFPPQGALPGPSANTSSNSRPLPSYIPPPLSQRLSSAPTSSGTLPTQPVAPPAWPRPSAPRREVPFSQGQPGWRPPATDAGWQNRKASRSTNRRPEQPAARASTQATQAPTSSAWDANRAAPTTEQWTTPATGSWGTQQDTRWTPTTSSDPAPALAAPAPPEPAPVAPATAAPAPRPQASPSPERASEANTAMDEDSPPEQGGSEEEPEPAQEQEPPAPVSVWGGERGARSRMSTGRASETTQGFSYVKYGAYGPAAASYINRRRPEPPIGAPGTPLNQPLPSGSNTATTLAGPPRFADTFLSEATLEQLQALYTGENAALQDMASQLAAATAQHDVARRAADRYERPSVRRHNNAEGTFSNLLQALERQITVVSTLQDTKVAREIRKTQLHNELDRRDPLWNTR